MKAEWRIYESIKYPTIATDNGLSLVRQQAIILTNAIIVFIRQLETYFSDFLSKTRKFSFMEMHLKMSSAKWRPFRLGLNVLTCHVYALLRKANFTTY